MSTSFEVGKFDLDVTLRDASLDEQNRPTRRMIANACIGIEAFEAYYSIRELSEALEAVHEGRSRAKARLVRILATRCDDFQRCIYYCLAGRGVVQMLDDLDWLLNLLEARSVISADLFRTGDYPIPIPSPYVAAEPDGPVVSSDESFEEGASWYLDPQLGGHVSG